MGGSGSNGPDPGEYRRSRAGEAVASKKPEGSGLD